MIRIKDGLDLPITGQPSKDIASASSIISRVALIGPDYVGLKPTMEVKEGDQVAAGDLLFSDKKNLAARYYAPFSGKVSEINRGEKRAFLSMVIERDGGSESKSYQTPSPESASTEDIKKVLIESGLWTALRKRPFGKVPNESDVPAAVFVRAMDTEPLAADPGVVIRRSQDDFNLGVQVVSKLTSGNTYVCSDPLGNFPVETGARIRDEKFDGPHPAGLVGTHIHFLEPVSLSKKVFYLDYQDAIAIGHLFRTGKMNNERIISLAGPMVKNPRHFRVPLGACLQQLTKGELQEGKELRIISGSVLSGRHANSPVCFLGRYHQQVSVIEEGRERVLLGWHRPGFNQFSIKNNFASKLIPWLKFPFTSSTNGSVRAIVPIEAFESVMPLDTEPTFLLRALISNDVDLAIRLGAQELEEEDIALCTFVCPGKNDYAPLLRSMLTSIEMEG